ncbi:serine/threonine-protein kinase [Pseudonocardia acaciae]|uniref:serine/threonine-protein kinase n=1 Tax=Pseudonocardia acaciae TaxID=551276 RepID=UPI0006851497|nr:serine/threonine-protein kinase [Pseudonocardia acaciae]
MEPLRADDPEGAGPYRFLGVLGSGGMGRVYLGGDRNGKLAAVKVVHDELAEDPGFRARFAREVEVASAVGAVGICAVLAADPEADRPWLATEYVPGPSLEQAVERAGPLAADPLRVLAAGLVGALAGLHAAGLVHRDVKPSNVMLSADGPRLIDFGIARAVDAAPITRTGALPGTPAYMSPEQAGDVEPGTASDIFSLASVLVFAATGHGPFGSTAHPVAMLLRIAGDEPNLDGVPDALAPVLRRCLAKEPASRPSAAELVTELPASAERLAGWPPEVVGAHTERLPHVAASRPSGDGDRTRPVDPSAETTHAVETVLVPAEVGHRMRNRGLWLGLGGAVVAAAVAGAMVFSGGYPGDVARPTQPAFDTPAALSAAIDAQVRKAGTLKSAGTVHLALGDIPTTMRYDAQLRIDGDHAWYAISSKAHSDPTHRPGGTALSATDTDGGTVALPGHLWTRNAPAAGAGTQWTDYPFDSTKATDRRMRSTVENSAWRYVNPLSRDVPAATLVGSDDEQLDGVATTRYTLRVDPAVLTQLAQDPAWRPGGPVSADPATTGSYTLWLDRQNRLVRFRSDRPAGSAWMLPMTQDVRFSGWGEPVLISPPPADQVTSSPGPP